MSPSHSPAGTLVRRRPGRYLGHGGTADQAQRERPLGGHPGLRCSSGRYVASVPVARGISLQVEGTWAEQARSASATYVRVDHLPQREQVAQLNHDKCHYLAQYEASLDVAIEPGYSLQADRPGSWPKPSR